MKRRGRRVLAGLVAGVAATSLGIWLVLDARVATTEPTAPVAWSEGRVRVEVLNVGGVTGMAGAATERLREAGFDVVDFGNSTPYDTTRASEVVDRVGRTDVATAVAKALGIGNVQSEPDPNLYVDVSVLLGSEWIEPGIRTERGQGDEVGRWWDPRGWFR